MATGDLLGSQSGLAGCGLLLSLLVLSACSVQPALREDRASDTRPAVVVMPAPADVVVVRAPADLERIGELEAQVANLQRQLADKQKQLAERNKQTSEEKQRLEIQIRESQQRASELQAKLDAILAVDRELRPTTRPAD